jgi:hypothetical protein
MARSHERSPSPDSASVIKKLKTSHIASETPASSIQNIGESPITQFTPELFDHNTIAKLRTGYTANKPFKYAVVEKLFQDELLKKVKDECLSELSFTEKQTDIYKVWACCYLTVKTHI